jgi:hypothetical protein
MPRAPPLADAARRRRLRSRKITSPAGNVVLGLFNYPTSDVGPDGTHEIDIEFARWGNHKNRMGNYTVWPVEKSLKQLSKSFPFTLADDQTTHWFIWSRESVKFRSLQGHPDEGGEEIASWIYSPDEPGHRISQQLKLARQVYVGPALTSHNSETAATARFRNYTETK